MMIYLKLFFSFFKIGLFSFGGGYAMIPLIQKEIEINGWLSASEFIDIISVSEMTPGPIAVNTATFVGYKTAGFLGGLVSTLGVSLPSLILILVVSGFFFRMQSKPANIMIFYGVRPAVTGLITAVAIFVAETAFLKSEAVGAQLMHIISKPLSSIDFGGIIILVLSLVALVKFKLHPILTIIGAGVAGVVIYYLIPLL